MNKLEFIKSYIDKCDEVISSQSTSKANKLQDEIIGVFESEIKDIRSMLSTYSMIFDNPVDFIEDIRIIKQKLLNYFFNIQVEQEKMNHEIELAKLKQPCVSAYAESNPMQTATMTSNINITIEQTVTKINHISESSLSKQDKETLVELLSSLDESKAINDKSKFWEKTKGVLKFLADKGADAAIATIPYILSGLL